MVTNWGYLVTSSLGSCWSCLQTSCLLPVTLNTSNTSPETLTVSSCEKCHKNNATMHTLDTRHFELFKRQKNTQSQATHSRPFTHFSAREISVFQHRWILHNTSRKSTFKRFLSLDSDWSIAAIYHQVILFNNWLTIELNWMNSTLNGLLLSSEMCLAELN